MYKIHTMNNCIVAWAAGLFEGEGTFQICKGKSKGICISSTDLDVLEKVQLHFGGSIYKLSKRKSHWKDSYMWVVRNKEAIAFYNYINPYLLKRRTEKGNEWVRNLPIKHDKEYRIIQLFHEGKTHKMIAGIVGTGRSNITKFLNRRNLRRLE